MAQKQTAECEEAQDQGISLPPSGHLLRLKHFKWFDLRYPLYLSTGSVNDSFLSNGKSICETFESCHQVNSLVSRHIKDTTCGDRVNKSRWGHEVVTFCCLVNKSSEGTGRKLPYKAS